MADAVLCSIDGCDNPADRRGWCTKHYARWYRNGDPTLGRAFVGDIAALFRMACSHKGEECLIWPFKKTAEGYAQMKLEGRTVITSRAVCEVVNGPPPSPEHQAAHSCGQGHAGCVSGGHLSWKTRSGNEADKAAHGTKMFGERHPNSKLNEADVRSIRQFALRHTYAEIAGMFSISEATVRQIVNHVTWRHVA